MIPPGCWEAVSIKEKSAHRACLPCVFTASPPGSSPMVSQVVAATSTVTWMMCNTNGPYRFDDPQAVVVAGSRLWVLNTGGNSLTLMSTTTGALISTIS